MTGAKGFDHPISKLTALSLYGDNEGIIIQFGRSTVSILMDAPYWVTKIVSLMGQQKKPRASGASFRLERSREPAQPERLEELPQPEEEARSPVGADERERSRHLWIKSHSRRCGHGFGISRL